MKILCSIDAETLTCEPNGRLTELDAALSEFPGATRIDMSRKALQHVAGLWNRELLIDSEDGWGKQVEYLIPSGYVSLAHRVIPIWYSPSLAGFQIQLVC
jgi:hypothetical protein